ncbi:MAG TPA: 3-hydroxyacyl-CoA dehydrogenase NAD-binding domain-containing protein [Cyclobacteriaceae bacterium]|nr:3-hydroxyacyl-CoA dehydrogenase NAD-binding domain-containing protein [Cyclobacteriaceae bacterium]
MITIRTVAVVGAGTMGLGIAQVCIMSGYSTLLVDVNGDQLSKAISIIREQLELLVSRGKLGTAQKDESLSRLSSATDLNSVKADLIIEAVVERMSVKQELFQYLERNNTIECILATNTSSLSVCAIASVLKNPERFLGIHFFNPADRMKLVELIGGTNTQPEYLFAASEFLISLKKTVVNAKDSPGFIVNRVARPYYVEALRLLEEKSADVATIDALMQAAGFRMGPFALMDLIGLDTNLAVTQSIFEGFDRHIRFLPSSIQQHLVEQGKTGIKAGAGFYDYAGKT